jgi:hypothetical protein
MTAPTDQLLRPHDYPGRLFIVEGIDGSGKSTQIRLLQTWLESQGYSVFFTEWNSADLIKATTKRAKKKGALTPTTFSLLHTTDFAHRLVTNILPPLKAGMIVLADRYVFTAYARDVVRGCSREWVRKSYSFAPASGHRVLLPRAHRHRAQAVLPWPGPSSRILKPVWTSTCTPIHSRVSRCFKGEFSTSTIT